MTRKIVLLVTAVIGAAVAAQCQSTDTCAALTNLKVEGVEVTKAANVPVGTTAPPYPGAPSLGPLPAHWMA